MLHDLGRRNAEPLGLHVEAAVKSKIGFVDQHRRAGGAMKCGETADVIDVRVRADDREDLQPMAAENLEDAFDIIARVHDDGLAGGGIAQDRAVALQHADGNHFVDELFGHRPEVYQRERLGRPCRSSPRIARQAVGQEAGRPRREIRRGQAIPSGDPCCRLRSPRRGRSEPLLLPDGSANPPFSSGTEFRI